jgi:hypothetical protein
VQCMAFQIDDAYSCASREVSKLAWRCRRARWSCNTPAVLHVNNIVIDHKGQETVVRLPRLPKTSLKLDLFAGNGAYS